MYSKVFAQFIIYSYVTSLLSTTRVLTHSNSELKRALRQPSAVMRQPSKYELALIVYTSLIKMCLAVQAYDT